MMSNGISGFWFVQSHITGPVSLEKNRLANKNVKKTVSDKSGYIIWKDRKVVIIYTNDLLITPKKDVLYSSDEQACRFTSF